MKKISIIVLSLLCAVFSSPAQDDRRFESCPLEVIEKGWSTKTIDNVVNGSLGIMLERFDQTWPTWMMGAVRNTMEKGLAKEVLEEETALTVIVDVKNGYVEVSDAGTDGEYMSACYWNRSNGHKLLAICMGDPTDPFIEFVCFYDYDPQKKTLTPQPGILTSFKKWTPQEPYYCHLPKVGKNMVLDEWNAEGHVRHIFTWNGMLPVYSKTEQVSEEDEGYSIYVSFKGAQPNIKDFVTALLSGDDLGEGLAEIGQCWEMYRNGMNLMPGCSFIVDVQNGYVGFESLESDSERQVIEYCYWNYADGKHKLVAMSNDFYMNGKPIAGQYTGLEFFKYNNATHKMIPINSEDLGIQYGSAGDQAVVAHSLPRKGKTIEYSIYTSSGKMMKRYTWNGSKFVVAL